MKRLLAAVAVLATLWPAAALAAEYAPTAESTDDPREIAVKVRAIYPDGARPVTGVRDDRWKIVVRNATADKGKNLAPAAIVLRGVHWDYREDFTPWRRQLKGRTVENADGTITYDPAHGSFTGFVFEAGLLRPGEEKTIDLPITPQMTDKHDLVVAYSFLENDDWKKDVWLEESAPARFDPDGPKKFYPAEATAEARGELAIVRQTREPGPDELEQYSAVFTFGEPFSKPLLEDALTGGLSALEAAKKAGADVLNENYTLFYRPPLGAWFFVRDDQHAMALKKADEVWEAVPMPPMETDAPEEFGGFEGGDTLILLSDEIRVGGVGYGPVPGSTRLAPEMFWRALRRAREKEIPVQRVTVRPTPVEPVRVLSAGVEGNENEVWVQPESEGT
ncbi:MAG TPA: hypothetical protein VL404_07145 [Candidatus Eisenbacteria bacterium]|nr:hypothetical protein [Candidatus Eisenbacteria bacterium]